jgi:hypothetical protein
MKDLPMFEPPASCSLDGPEMREQAARYARIGAGAQVVDWRERRFEIRLADGTDLAEVDRAVAVERECCSFFAIEWDPAERRLAFGVATEAEAPALGAIADALGVG